MIDYAKITVKAGNGGNGSGSFEHIKGKRRGKADGGDGGRGGNVYFEATLDLNTLEPFRFVKHYEAQGGKAGLSKKRKGAEGADLVIKVPAGTEIKVTEANLDFDLVDAGQRILVARGGEGGRGNCHLRDEYGRRPFKGEEGRQGEEQELVLELKLIAQVGLIGLPNAGKSTLLSRLTMARPKIADYPFTTLEPNLGVFNAGKRKLVIADIPGLIEGASEGRGLGDLFLRHVERTKILVHLVDASSGDVLSNYQIIRDELKGYSKELSRKKEVIALNKADLADKSRIDEIVDGFKKKRKKVYIISALTGEGVESLVKEVLKRTG